MSLLQSRMLIGLVLMLGVLSCQTSQPDIRENMQCISETEEILKGKEEVVENHLLVSTDSIFRLEVIKTVAVLPDGYDYLSKDSIVLSCLELTRVDSTFMLLPQYVTESWSRPEYYLTAIIRNKDFTASSSHGLFVFEKKSIKFYYSSDALDKFQDSARIDIGYDFRFFGLDMKGHEPIFIQFNEAEFQSKIQELTADYEGVTKGNKKWFLTKGIPQGVSRSENEVYITE